MRVFLGVGARASSPSSQRRASSSACVALKFRELPKLTFGKGSVGARIHAGRLQLRLHGLVGEERLSAAVPGALRRARGGQPIRSLPEATAVALRRRRPRSASFPRRGPTEARQHVAGHPLLATVPIGGEVRRARPGRSPRRRLELRQGPLSPSSGTSTAGTVSSFRREEVLFEASGWIRSLAIAPGRDAVASPTRILPQTYPEAPPPRRASGRSSGASPPARHRSAVCAGPRPAPKYRSPPGGFLGWDCSRSGGGRRGFYDSARATVCSQETSRRQGAAALASGASTVEITDAARTTRSVPGPGSTAPVPPPCSASATLLLGEFTGGRHRLCRLRAPPLRRIGARSAGRRSHTALGGRKAALVVRRRPAPGARRDANGPGRRGFFPGARSPHSTGLRSSRTERAS